MALTDTRSLIMVTKRKCWWIGHAS